MSRIFDAVQLEEKRPLSQLRPESVKERQETGAAVQEPQRDSSSLDEKEIRIEDF